MRTAKKQSFLAQPTNACGRHFGNRGRPEIALEAEINYFAYRTELLLLASKRKWHEMLRRLRLGNIYSPQLHL